jgi:beta-lactamase regulating signal transducer with metallopeptidase domain
VADPITDLVTALTTNFLCLIGAMVFFALFMILLVVLRIRKVRSEQNWAYNPGKTLKLRWRRG